VIHPILELIMAKRSLGLILPVFVALGGACGGDGGFAPRLFIALEVSPAHAVLSTVAPGNTFQLTTRAYDQAGAPMSGAGAVTYTSSAPAIAGVSRSGVVTAAAPGTAKITTALTLGGITRTASTTVLVHAGDLWELTGVYDLSALITSFDPGRGEDLTGYRYTAVLTLRQEWDFPWFGGAYADFQLVGSGGESYAVADAGVVTGSIDPRGRVLIELLGDGNHIGLTLIVDTLASGTIDGTFGCCGHIGGTFTAARRP